MRRFRHPRLGLPHLVLALVFFPLADPEPAHAARPTAAIPTCGVSAARMVCSEVAVVAARFAVRTSTAAGPEALGSPPRVGR